MKITKKADFSGITRAEYPFFENEAAPESVTYMNNFSEKLISEIKSYCETLPAGYTYCVSYDLTEDGDIISVVFNLRLRIRGRGTERKSFTVTWKDGYMLKFEGERGDIKK